MKYIEFLELQETLKERNITISDIKTNVNVLNEISIVGAIASVLTLGGLLTIFSKSLIRYGIKNAYLKVLNNQAKEFEKEVTNHTSKLGKNAAEIRETIRNKANKLKDQGGEEAEEEMEILKNQKREYERRYIRDINEFITKVSSIKSKEIYEKIDGLKKLKETQKSALKVFWEMRIPYIRQNAFHHLVKDGIITDKAIIDEVKKELKSQLDEAKKKSESSVEAVKKESSESEDKEISIDSIKNSIKDLDSKKEDMESEELIKKVAVILNNAKKFPIEDRKDIYQELVDTFGRDSFDKARNILKKEDDVKQTTLKTDDDI